MKRSIQAITVLALSFFMISCIRDVAPKPTVDLSTDVIVKDKSGNNLLSSTQVNGYKFEDIHLYNIKADGTRGELVNTSGKYFEMVKDQSGQSILRINPFLGSNSKSVVTAIRWRANDEDVLELGVSSDSQPAHTMCNGKHVTQSTNPSARRVVEIIK